MTNLLNAGAPSVAKQQVGSKKAIKPDPAPLVLGIEHPAGRLAGSAHN
jgi:hypothetical protein